MPTHMALRTLAPSDWGVSEEERSLRERWGEQSQWSFLHVNQPFLKWERLAPFVAAAQLRSIAQWEVAFGTGYILGTYMNSVRFARTPMSSCRKTASRREGAL